MLTLGHQSLRWKLAVAMIGFSVIVISGLGIFAYQSGRTALITATASDLVSAASEKEQAVASWLRQARVTLVAISHSPNVSGDLISLTAEQADSAAADALRVHLARELESWVGPEKPFQSLLVIEPEEGRVLYSTFAGEVLTFKENREYFRRAQTEPVVVGPFHSITTGSALFAAAAPIRKPDGALAGVLVGRLNMSEIDWIMQRRSGLSDTFDSYLVNTARLFVSQPRQLPDPAVLVRGAFTTAVDQCLVGKSGWNIAPDYRNIYTITAYQWLPDLRLCILAKLDREEAFRPSIIFGWTTLAGGVAATVAAAVLALFLSNWIARPMGTLLSATRAIRDGNLDVSIPIRGNDEFAQLAQGFSEMADSLKAKDQKIEDYTRTLELRVDEALRKNREKDAVVLQQSRLAALGEMIGNIAHQWRQPLNALSLILGNLKDAQEHGELDETYLHDQVEQGQAIASGMSTTIEDFRNFFRPEREKQRFCPSDAVRNALKLVEAAFNNDKIDVAFTVHEDVEVLGFPNEYAQVVLNLLVNARDAIRSHREMATDKSAAQQTTGSLRIVLGRAGDAARLTVTDTGGGVPAHILNKVFDPYFTTRESGTGIGLYLSKTIIERNMDGRIEVRNVKDGAEFTVDTPLAT
ncbi:sensor histidine kinase [Antarctobacter sp.]|uniref:sensor histidine kinase n=1 Tax=Antarctobacter sp. TaxID=1872577 RepID=UPI002B2682D0|nr:ATP-binding protein [Antarctobacter sp.]